MKTSLKKLSAFLLTLVLLLSMAAPVIAAGDYAYEDDFSDSADPVESLPEGWVRHPNFKNGTLYQKDGALYFDTKTASGICVAFYEQKEYSDYMIEADFTMLDRTNDARWMGISYRVDSDERAINNFVVTYNNVTSIHGYYYDATTGYDGSVVGAGWNIYDGKYFVKETLSATNHPEVVNAAKTTVNLKLVVVGDSITGYINGVEVLNAVAHNETQASGSFGISTSNANIKVENFKVTDLTPKPEEPEESPYTYEAKFSTSATEIEQLPEGWKEHPHYRNGTVTQKDGSMFFKTKSASGICAIYYDQDAYTDYRIEAEMTMLDKVNTARWMGLVYRMDDDENCTNLFSLTWNNSLSNLPYNYKETTGYDGSTTKSWATADGVHFIKKTISSSVHPEILNAAQSRCKFTLEVVGNQITGYINDVKVLEAITHNMTQEKGSFGIATSQADIQIHSFKVTDLTQPEEEITEPYAYVADFSDTAVDGLPEGWKQHPNYKAGSFSQNNHAFYFKSKTGSGIGSVYYDQNMYHDYLVSADFTMEDKTDNNRWMGFTYRMNGDEKSTNMFVIKYNNAVQFTAYYSAVTDGYEGGTLSGGWAPIDGVYFTQDAKPANTHPELAGAGATKVNLKMAIVGGKFYGFVNNVKVLEAKIHNAHQALGSFGVSTSNADIKVENYRAIDLTELCNAAGASVAHGITLPASVNGKLMAQAQLGNYAASTTVAFGDKATAAAKILVAKSGDTELYVNVCKDGAVTVTCGDVTQTLGTATVADTANVVIQTVYANGAVRVLVDGNEVGYGFALQNLPGKYGYILDGNTTVNAITLNETTTNVTAVSFQSELSEIEFGATPDWSKVRLVCQLSDGTEYKPTVTSDMISGFDPNASGTQTLTLTYLHGGKSYTEKFNVTVKDDPENMPLVKVGIISDVHIGANASNIPGLEKALTYYKNKGVDIVVCTGDLAHNYMEYLDGFNEVVQRVFPDGGDVVKLFVMGNHDTYAFEADGYTRYTDGHNAAVEDYFTNTFGVQADYGREGLNYYNIVNGYIFAGLYIQTPIAEREAFIEHIFSLPEAQGKPVFIANHEIPVGSVYIAKSGATSEDELHDVLKNYPNAVVLAGHSHNPLADERALWQGEYTVVSCGSIFGSSVEEYMYEGGSANGSFQPGNWDAKHALYMEVREAGINIERYDFAHDEKLGKDWFIPVNDGVVDRTPYNYELRTAAAVAPEFASDAQVTAQPLSESMVRITFPGCFTVYENQDDIVHSYIIRAYNDDTGELVATKRVLSQHYLGRVPEKESHTITYTGLNAQTNYRFEVVAVESYQKESAPLVVKADTKAFSTAGLTATFYANFDYGWDADEFDVYNHKDTNSLSFADGVIRVPASNSSKAILKGLNFSGGTVETLIHMNSTAANINGGIYLFASNAANDQDTIHAHNVHVDSAVGSRDLQVALYKFTGKYDGNLKSIVLKDYFADGNAKAPVKLKVEYSNNILSVFVDDVCVLTHTLSNMSGLVGLRSHYAGSDFDYFRVYDAKTEYTAPDTAALDAAIANARNLLASVEVEGAEGFTGKNPYVTREAYDALANMVEQYDTDMIRAYERHISQVVPMLTAAVASFETGIMQPAAAVVGQIRYATVAEAVANANGQIVTVLADTDEAISVNVDVTIDLAGHTLGHVTVAEGATLYGMDSATDAYDCTDGYGKIGSITGSYAQHHKTVVNGNPQRYLTVVEEDGISFHRLYMGIQTVSLKPGAVGFGYKAIFGGDEKVKAALNGEEAFGYKLWVDSAHVISVSKNSDAFVSGNSLSLLLKNFDVENYGQTRVNATVYVKLADGTVIESAEYSYSMKDMVELINDSYTAFTPSQLLAVADMILKYPVMQNWNVGNILKIKTDAKTLLDRLVVSENRFDNAEASWTRIDENTVRGVDYTYRMDDSIAYDDVEMRFKLSNISGSVATGGILLRCTTYDNKGVDGYLINYVTELNLLQVYYLQNVYNSDGSPLVVAYVGGIEYAPMGNVVDTEFWAKLEGNVLTLNTAARQAAGEDALAVVDLTLNGQYPLYTCGYTGILAWTDNVAFDLTLAEFKAQ